MKKWREISNSPEIFLRREIFEKKSILPLVKGDFEKKFYYPFDEGRFLREKIFSPFRREILKRESPFEFTLSLKGEKNYQREKILDIPDILCIKALSIHLQKIRSVRGCARKLQPDVRYADTLHGPVSELTCRWRRRRNFYFWEYILLRHVRL